MANEYDGLSREELIALLRRKDSQAQYGLVWEQKDIAPDKALNRDFVGLTLDPALSCGEGPWSNLIIEGDNYDALRNLVSCYAGQVKLIYIDPPYNTGRRDFVYNDNYFDATDRFRHSTWLEFMYQRLQLAKDLLAKDGAIFVSIDDNELFNLGLLMSKVFGERNFIANCIWQKVFSPKNTAQHFSDDHEYMLVYAANRELWKPNAMPRTAAQDSAYRNPDNDPRGVWTSSDLSARNFYSAGTYSVIGPKGQVIAGPPPGRYWTISQEKFKELDEDKRIWWGHSGRNAPRLKRFLSEVKQGVVPQTLWSYAEVGHTQDAKKQLNEIVPTTRSEEVFSTPKPLQLMERVLRLGTGPNDLVLDFFAGSGTLAHALLKLNAEDGGQRRFILVSNTEATAAAPEKNLCRDVCALRLRRAIEGYETTKGDVPGLGGHFAYLTTQTVPVHRLEEQLTDAMIWSFLQMRHDHPLTAGGAPLSLSVQGDEAIAYLNSAKKAGIAALQDALARHPGLIVYTWSAAALAEHMDANNIRSVPEALVRAFRFGHLTTGALA